MSDCIDSTTTDTGGPLPDVAGGGHVLEVLVDAAADGLALLSLGGQFVRVNEALTQLLGVPREGLLGRFISDEAIGLGMEVSSILDALSSDTALSRMLDLPGGRTVMATLRVYRDVAAQPQHLVLATRDMTAIGRLVGRVQTGGPAPASEAQWSRMRRGEVGIDRIVTESSAMRAVAEKALQFAQVDSPVLIVGETGTGKSLFARIIHQASPRGAGPLREVNCGAIPAGLMETELFGYARGAFTGADAKGKTGLIELASNGTLLLDEVGDLPLLLQVKLLQFLEAGEVWPVGGAKPKRVNVRVIAATNADLTDMVGQGTFRRDLFYRLNVLVLQVPPLREHPEDVEPLVEMMAGSLERRLGKRVRFAPDALDVLKRYPFPGNIRELWNIVERVAVLCRSGLVGAGDLPPEVIEAASSGEARSGPTNLRQLLRKVEAGIVRDALQRYGSQSKAAKHLGVGQATIARKARLLDTVEQVSMTDEPRSSISG
jgi:transcriptional regulator with PAS, ATPase and Fis domain